MISRRWVSLLAVFALMTGLAAEAMAATTAGDVIHGDGGDVTTSVVQEYAVKDLAEKTGGSVSEFRMVLRDSSHSQFIPATAKAAQSTSYDTTSQNTIETLFAGGNGSAGEVIAGLNVLNGVAAIPGVEAAYNVVNAIAGNGGVLQTRNEVIMAERRSMVERFGSDASLAADAMNSNLMNRFWFSPFHTKQKGERNGVNEAYDFKATGVSLGYDRSFGCFTMGGAFTYSRGDYDVKGVNDDNTIDTYGFSLYGQFYNPANGVFATVTGGYAYHDNEYNRYIAASVNLWQRGENHTNSWYFGGNVGKDFAFDSGSPTKFILTPTVGLYWADNKGSEYTANGAVNQVIGTMKQKSFQLPVDVAARVVHELNDCSSVTVKVAGGYSYNFKNDGAEGTVRYNHTGSDTFGVYGAAPGRHGWNIGAGVKYQYKNMDLGVDYRYDGRKKFDGHRVSATVGVNF